MSEVAAVRRPRKLLIIAGLCCLGVLVAGLIWLIVTAMAARSHLKHAQAELPALRQALLAGDVTKARALSDDIRDNARSAHGLTSGPAWWVGAHLPGLGRPLQTARAVSAAADSVGQHVLPGIVQLGDTVTDSSLRSGESLDLTVLAKAEPVVDRSAAAAKTALAKIEASPAKSWLGSVDSNRAALATQLAHLDDDLTGASRALHTALPMLGQHGPRRYFVGFMNEAESRGLGGLPGAFAIVTVDHGTFRFTHFGTDETLNGVHADVDLGAEYDARYGSADPTTVFQNSDIGPDFRDAAQIWAGMWEKKSGEHVDGAIAVDPTALSYLLRVTGPAPLHGGGEVTADNVVALTQQTQYAKFPDKPERKKYIIDVSDAISERITSGSPDTVALMHAVARGAHERRLMIWSSQADEERALVTANYAGALPSGSGPVTGFVTVNAAGSKLDYYLDRSMTYQRSSCDGRSTATATMTLRNEAPRKGLPAYVTIRGDHPTYRTRPGDNRLIVTYYGTAGAAVTSVLVDGKPVAAAVGTERGLTTASIDLELPVGRARTVTVRLTEPATTGPVSSLVQPGAKSTAPERPAVSCPAGHN